MAWSRAWIHNQEVPVEEEDGGWKHIDLERQLCSLDLWAWVIGSQSLPHLAEAEFP